MEKQGRFHGTLAMEYEYIPAAVPGYMQLQRELGRKVAHHFKRSGLTTIRVLEIGTGTGITTKELLAADKRIVIISLENEPDMAAKAEKELEEHIRNGSLRIVQADAREYLPQMPSEFFDCCATAHTLHNFTRADRALLSADIYRVLKPGGLFINTDKYRTDDEKMNTQLLAEQLALYRKVFAQYGVPPLIDLWTAHELEDAKPEIIMQETQAVNDLRKQGFANIAVTGRIELYAVLQAKKPASK